MSEAWNKERRDISKGGVLTWTSGFFSNRHHVYELRFVAEWEDLLTRTVWSAKC